MINYILVVDDEEDIRDIYEMILRRAFPLDVVLAGSGNHALEIIEQKGMPEIIISDFNMPNGDGLFLYNELRQKERKIPFVICSAESEGVLKKKFPEAYGFIEKPRIIEQLIKIVGSVVAHYKAPPAYIPLRISLLLRWGTTNFDLFMKLSETNYVKVLNADEAFIPVDAERFYSKQLQHLFIRAGDANLYLEMFEKSIAMVIPSDNLPADISLLTLESLESVERIAASLGWSSDVLCAAQHAVNLAIKAVTLEPNILKLLKKKLDNPISKYSDHIGTLSLLNCGFCYKLGWTSESTQMKLGLASLLHDLTLDESKYHDVHSWNLAATDLMDKTPETLEYRNHPNEAANLLLSMKNIPANVDQIILQHHEMKDGSGFPRGLISNRITPMACVFIIVEDLINFLDYSQNLDEKIALFLENRESRYDSGNFKKVFEVLSASAKEAKKNT
jgi:two-component system chemotaxis response regulator CheY